MKVQSVVEQAFGIRMRVEQVGGGNTALVGKLEGVTLVLSDGNLGHDLDSGEGVSVGLYGAGDWMGEEQNEALSDAWVPCEWIGTDDAEVQVNSGEAVVARVVAMARAL